MAFLQEQDSLSRFRRALRRRDQIALDDLFAAARQHLAAAAYAGHALPFDVFLLAMLLEEHKEVMRLRSLLENVQVQIEGGEPASQVFGLFGLGESPDLGEDD